MRYQSPTQLACGSKEFIPHSRFPQGKAGSGMVPPTAQTTRLPPQEGFQSAPLKSPLRDPPARPWLHRKVEVLAGMPAGTVKHHLVLGMVPLAGFEVITDGRF
jgi:hypothetical protein